MTEHVGVPEPREQRVAVGDITLRVLRWRSEGLGAPLLMVHPNATGAEIWAPFAGATQLTNPLIAPDLRGHGDSSRTTDRNDVDTWAADLQGLLEALDVGPVVVLASALGGAAALLLASRWPRSVVGVVANDVGYDIPEDVRLRVQRRLRESHRAPDAATAMAGYHAATFFTPQQREWFAQVMLQDDGDEVVWRYDPVGVPKVMDPRPRSLLDELDVRCPTLLLRGEHSGPLLPEALARLQATIPGAQVATITRSDHIPSVDATRQYTRLVDDFVGRLVHTGGPEHRP